MASDSHTTNPTDFSAAGAPAVGISPTPSWSPLSAPARAASAGRPLRLDQRIRAHAKVAQKIREFLQKDGYTEVPVPLLTPSTGSCSVVDAVFTIDYFSQIAFPRQTGQLYLEEIMVRGLDAVYCEGPSLRREWKVDNRHLTEFKLIEVERRDLDLAGLCDLQERLIKRVASALSAEDLGGENVTRLDRMIRSEHPRMTYRQAVAILRRKGFALDFGDPLGRDAESALVHHAGQLPVHITHFPSSLKFFNAKVDRSDPATAECVDYILPYSGETFGGAVRETDTEILRRRLYDSPMYARLMTRSREFAQDQWLTREGIQADSSLEQLEARYQETITSSYEKYIGLFDGTHLERAGFGLGLARLLQYYMGLDSIKDAVIFPMDRTSFGVMSDSL